MTIESERSTQSKTTHSGSGKSPVQRAAGLAERSPLSGGAFSAAAIGSLLSGCFYGVVWSIPWGPLERYFLGHPVAVAATVLFWFAIAVLAVKWTRLMDQTSRLAAVRDHDLMPGPGDASPAERWLDENDAGHVSRRWLSELSELPAATRSSLLVRRLEELLTRQSQRGSTRHLADDLRELSGRDADAAHDSLGLVRIIIWAIPMLGFLGTVIGITQTLGGLDFSDGTAAVDNLKSGLYVAFDTTALGLVLSVVAIFLQFPVERSEQRLLAEIDARVGHLVSASLPSDEASDNQTVLIADLCRGVQAAVAESLENQAKLWRETIDAAQQQWQSTHDLNTNRLAEAFEVTLVPALVEHGESVAESSQAAAKQLSAECERWQQTLNQAHEQLAETNASTQQALTDALESIFKPALENHAATMDQSACEATDRMEQVWRQWQHTIEQHTATLSSHQQSLITQYATLTETHHRADAVAALQQSLNENVLRLEATNQSIDQSIDAAAGHGMADAMRILARAVDLLSARLAESTGGDRQDRGPATTRQAA